MAGDKTNLAAVRSLVDDAEPIAMVHRELDPPLGGEHNGVAPGKWTGDRLGLPPDCPVRPLGVSDKVGYFIDPIGQVQAFEPPYGKGHLLGLFAGRANYLAWAWPRFGKKDIDGYAAEQAAAALINACFAQGPWSNVEKVRGRGIWMTPNGQLVVHTGTELLLSGAKRPEPPGEIDGFVYPTRPKIPRPYPGAEAPAKILLPLLRTWNWARPDVDPVLLLGWIGAAFLGGALPWRPTVFATGDKATGKSTLQALIKGLLGEWLIQSNDTSAAGIYQHVGQDALPVAVDEIEGEADVRKQKAVLRLARLAASGGFMLRGGDRHQGVEFQARSCFFFSSINTPPLEPQDLSRMALLRLWRLTDGQAAPNLSPQAQSNLGRSILTRVISQWPRFHETWAAYRAELAAGGMDGRGQDTFGTLLACADLIQYDTLEDANFKVPVEGDLVSWRELMAVGRMAEFEDAAENWRLCLGHLLSVPVDAWRNGTRTTVGQVVFDTFNIKNLDEHEAKRLLAQAGLTLQRQADDRRVLWLAIPNQNPLTRTLFQGSKWAGDVGAGVWAGALRQAPLNTVHRVGSCRVNGEKTRATLISLEALYGKTGIMMGTTDDEL